jgi:hypothetical protein
MRGGGFVEDRSREVRHPFRAGSAWPFLTWSAFHGSNLPQRDFGSPSCPNPNFVRVARDPPEADPTFAESVLRDRNSSQRGKQMRRIASFIIHYVDWQAEKVWAHARRAAIRAEWKASVWPVIRSEARRPIKYPAITRSFG